MSFQWPLMLLLLALIPVGLGVYGVIGRRRRQAAARSGLGLMSRGSPTPSPGSGVGPSAGSPGGASSPTRSPRFAGVRTRIPAVFFIAGIAVLTIAMARPQGTVDLPTQEGTVILAIDVSGSMAATDLQPNRMAAAKAATDAFVQRQPSSVVVGVVAFSDSGLSVQAPTKDQGTVLSAINRLSPQKGTSLGQGIQASLDAINQAEAGTPPEYYSNRSPAPTATPAPVAPGSHSSAVIVLLTDGENNERPDPLTVAQTAANEGIRIYTVGLGTEAGTTLNLDGFSVHTQLNAPLLQQIAQTTGGEYFAASSAQDLQSIYANLNPRLLVKPQTIEVTSIFAGAAILLFALGGLTSLLWLGRLP